MAEHPNEPQPDVPPAAEAATTPAGQTPPRDPAPTEPARQTATKTRSRAGKADKADKDPLRGSRTSGLYVGVAALGIILILLIIFIAQNTRKTTVTFLSWEGQVSVAVALLIAAAAGLFLALLASGLRILQLRRRVKRTR